MSIISVIQVCKNKDDIVQSSIDELVGVLEVLIIESGNPSWARNACAQKAQGDIILFLDDDSIIGQETILNYIETFKKDGVDVVGGPAIVRHCKRQGSFLSKLCASPFAFGPSRARYCAIGRKRWSNEGELILCNLAFRRSVFLESGGFNEGVYPGEENELLLRLKKNGVKMMYDPKLLTTRGMTSSTKLFLRKIHNYAYGRVVGTRSFSFLHVLPLIFLVMIALSLVWSGARWVLTLYAGVILWESWRLFSLRKSTFVKAVIVLPLIHLTYGVGMVRGLLFLFRQHRLRQFFYTGDGVNNFK